MSTRKSTNKAATDSSVSTSPDSSSIRSTTTRSALQIPGSEPDVADSGASLDAKRPRRQNVRTPTTPSSSSKKKSDDNAETMSAAVDADDKTVKASGDESKSEECKKTDSLTDSPARAARKRKVFDKTAIVTRRSALDLANSTKRVLRDRRNSTGKCEENEPKKRTVKKSTSLTPEPPISLKRKRENSTKQDDKEEMKKAEKMIKLELIEPGEVQKTESEEKDQTIKSEDLNEEDKLKLLVEETDSKDDELVEVVEIKQELDEDTEDVPMEENIAKEMEEEQKSEDQDKLDVKQCESISKDIIRITDEAKDEEKLSDSEITIAKLFGGETDSKKLSLSNEHDKKKSEEQNDSKKASETTQISSTEVDKKTATNNDAIKTEEDAKFEAYERPRRARAKKLTDTPPTPVKRGGRKSDKPSTEDTCDIKTKAGKKIQPKTLSSETSKTEEVIKIVSVAESEVEAETQDDKSVTVEIVNGVENPLIVDISSSETTATEKEPGTSTDQTSEKAASLSPELISEGVSVISVKQFYKKPEFLENNLGIEKDPKLGEIVQEVEKSKDETASTEIVLPSNSADLILEKTAELVTLETSPDCSGDSLKEGERLVLDDSTEEDGNISIHKIEANDENESANSGETTEITTDFIISEDSEQTELKIEEQDETLSNSAPTEEVDELQINCDSTNVNNTAVDTNEVKENVQEGDNEIKDIITCNKNSMEEEVSDRDKQQENNIEAVPSEKETDKIESIVEEEEEKESSEQVLTEVDSEELPKIENNNIIIEDSEECQSEAKELKADVQENSMDTDELNENKENVMEDADIKNVVDNIQCFVSPSKKDENSEDDLTDDKNEKKLLETPETLKQKENHLKHLGLLTHKAAVEAKIEKQERRKLLQSSSRKNGGNNGASNNGQSPFTNDSVRNNGSGNGSNCNENSQEYTGTLKTVIKLNRKPIAGCSGNNGRQSLKMTFQKGRGRGINSNKDPSQSANSGDDTYYTIQNETEGTQQEEAVTHGRKSHNRYHSTDVGNPGLQENVEKKDEKEIILIPEKASSFAIHPGRLCQDQCFYCGGKFGLYDTPCHVAQLKSVERQQKILANEEKLTVDNCLCEACFRHVDRRANAPQSYKKRLSAPSALESNNFSNSSTTLGLTDTSTADELSQSAHPANTSQTKSVCFVPDCNNHAAHPLRRKFIRKTIKKILPNFDMSTIGSSAPICSQHYDAIVQFLGCALCKRRLVKNNMYYINQVQESEKLEKLLAEQSIPVKLGNNTAVCKLCRYFTNLLLKPPDIGKVQKKQFVKNYRKRLLHFYNIQAEDTSDGEEHADDKSENESLSKHEEHPKIEKRGRKKKTLQTADSGESEKSSRANTNTPQSSEEGQGLASGGTSGQMMLDNDVMVDYDMPVPISESPSPPPLQMPSKLQTILQGGNPSKDDISIVLRSNPNISMRELFPGEEEMGLQIKVPFGGSTSVRTPEGWTRVNTFLQYDEPTRRLWEDLQKPYGNQSSFLRHLILLEKYFRNGDLILSQNASTNAVVYSDTVQNRLKSYDNLNVPPTNRPSKSKTKSANGETSAERISKQFSNLPVTITAKPKNQPVASTSKNANNNNNNSSTVSSGNLNSILKRNLLSNNRAIEILPISSNSDSGSTSLSSKSGISIGMTRQQRLLEAATRLISNSQESNSNQAGNKKTGSGSCVGVPPELISINRSPMQLLKNRPAQIQPKPGTSKSIPPNVIVLPDSLSPLERMQSKNWRPTLVPVSSVNPGAHLNASGPLYQTADGRRLPALVQVQSGGRPFLISIYDYNRMCILRREKLMREQMAKGGKKSNEDSGNKGETSQQQQSQQSNKMQIPNKILEQNSLIPVSAPNKSQLSLNTDQKNKKQPQQSLLKSSLTNPPIPIAPKPTAGSLPVVPPSIASQQHTIVLGQNNPTASAVSILPTLPGVLTIAPPSTTASSTSWLWSNVNDSNNPANGNIVNKNVNLTASSSSASSSNSSSPSVVKQQQQQQGNPATVILDNSLLSKIPKSLTVIPQQKSKERSRGDSVEDLTSA